MFRLLPRLRLCNPFSSVSAAAAPAAFLSAVTLITNASAQPSAPIRWSCIGNSITQFSHYSDTLQSLLGPAFKVENDGVSGTTLLKVSNLSYWTNGKFPAVFALQPDIVTIKLGTNDSKPINWPNGKTHFLADYLSMIDTLGTLKSKPKIFPCYPVPAFLHNGAWTVDGINDPTIKDSIMPLIKQAADTRNLTVFDLHSGLVNRADLFANDGVHPDSGRAGSDSIATFIYRAFKAQAIRIACIGNSITDAGHSATAYPIRFNQLLGRNYYVLNAGHSGKTLLRNGDAPYIQSPWFAEVFKFKPNIITITLGTNDSKPQNWDAHKNEFVTDYEWFIDTLSTLNPKPRIILCTPIPAWTNPDGSAPYGIRGDTIKLAIIPRIKQVAQEKGLTVLDLYTPFLPYQKLTSDNIHPNDVGLDTLAHILYRTFEAVPTAVARPAPIPQMRRENVLPPAIPNPLAPLGVDAAGRKR